MFLQYLFVACCDLYCQFSLDSHLAVVENLACSREPKSDAVGSLVQWRKGRGGGFRQRAIQNKTTTAEWADDGGREAPQRPQRRKKAAARMGTQLCWSPMPLDPVLLFLKDSVVAALAPLSPL